MENSTSIHEQGVVDALASQLKQHGFDWLPRLHQFRRSTEHGFSCLILSSSPAAEGSIMEAHIGLRLDAVENLSFPFTNGLPGFQPDSMTLVTPIARLYGQRFQRLSLRDEKDREAAAQLFGAQLEESGLPFINQYSHIQALDLLFNHDPMAPLALVHNQINRCFRGIVLSKLVQSPDFEEVAKAYVSALEGKLYAPEPTLAKFHRLSDFLRHYSMN
ncbi:MAG: hypothetical protein RIC19_05230 [Phaeodactylibacter sp.]|uniref:hypothetical protein n=1 Tax=Phaeodactylibacter sp. TaxID=1940289 RepID=UPI0032EB6340